MKSIFKITQILTLSILVGIFISCGPNTEDPGNPKFTVTFHANNGSDEVETQELEYGVSSKLRKNTFEYEGFIFLGWSLSEDSEQVKYADETSIAIKNDLDLYAVWQSEENTVKIIFWANTSEDDSENVIQYAEKNTSVNLRANSFTNEGYTFAGWLTDTEHTNADYVDKATVSINSNLNLYALWINASNTGTVILHSNTEEDETITLYFSYNDSNVHYLADDIFVRDGYRIEGWSEKPDATPGLLSGNYIQPARSWMFEKETLHYYCIWQKEAAYTLTFYPNYEGAEDQPVKIEFARSDFSSKYAKFKIFEPDLFKREGYELVGWSTTEDTSSIRSNITYHGAESDSFMHDSSLYAVWKEADFVNLIHYTYYKNDEKAELEDEEKIVIPYLKASSGYAGYDIGLAPEVFTREGKVFEGWKEVRNRSDKTVSTYSALYQKTTNSSSEDMSYYAMWHTEKPVITFKANFEGSEYEDIIVTTNYQEKNTFPECSWIRDGYGFAGWSKDPDSISGSFAPYTYQPEDDTVYYAVWKKDPVITFHANYDGSEEEDKTQVVPYDKETELEDIVFSRTGYFLMGYTTSPTSTYSPKKAGDKVRLTADTDYYAVWAKARTIIYHSNYKTGPQSQVSDQHPEGYEFYTREDCPFEAPEDYYFAGWASVKDATYNNLYSRRVSRYTFSDYNEGDYEVYATWFKFQHVNLISNYAGNGSKEKVIPYTIKIGEKLYITQEIVDQFTAPEGKGFWCFGANGTKNVTTETTSTNVKYEIGKYFDSTTDNFTGTFDLYAQWRSPITITLQANFEGALPESKDITIPYGTHLNAIPLPEEWDRSESKYHFWGWSTNKNESTNYIPSDSRVIYDNSKPLLAIWLNPVKYTYHYNYEGSEEVYEDYAEQGYDYMLIENMFTPPEGKKFKCWCTKDNEKSGVKRDVGYKVSDYYNKTDSDFYAIWIDE